MFSLLGSQVRVRGRVQRQVCVSLNVFLGEGPETSSDVQRRVSQKAVTSPVQTGGKTFLEPTGWLEQRFKRNDSPNSILEMFYFNFDIISVLTEKLQKSTEFPGTLHPSSLNVNISHVCAPCTHTCVCTCTLFSEPFKSKLQILCPLYP